MQARICIGHQRAMSSQGPPGIAQGCACNLHTVPRAGLCLFSTHFTPATDRPRWKLVLLIEFNVNPHPASITGKSAGKLFVLTSSPDTKLQCCTTKLNVTCMLDLPCPARLSVSYPSWEDKGKRSSFALSHSADKTPPGAKPKNSSLAVESKQNFSAMHDQLESSVIGNLVCRRVGCDG